MTYIIDYKYNKRIKTRLVHQIRSITEVIAKMDCFIFVQRPPANMLYGMEREKVQPYRKNLRRQNKSMH